MSFRSLTTLRCAVSLASVLVLSACTDNRTTPLTRVNIIDIPEADAGQQANQNISSPTLFIPETFPVADGDELTLVWSEEFDGPEIDPETWFFATGDGTEKGLPGGWGNNELQYYLPDNAMIVNGVLEITARRETVGDLDYTSARINTEDRFAFKYGRIEASIKMPSGQGLWPAFWMLSQDSDYTCDGDPCVWAAIGEIDIVEAINLDGTNGNDIFATIHYGGEFPANESTSVTYTPSVDVTEDFHTYALEWDEFELRWYFDGQLYAVQNSWFSTAENGGPGAPFNQNFHILLNLAVGGNFPGDPNGATPFPATMEVDWVRVYSGEEPAPDPADPGTKPDVKLYDPDGNPDLVFGVDYADITPFGSGAMFDGNFTGDIDFSPAFSVTTGFGYGKWNAQLAYVGFAAGFAAAYETLDFKVKGLSGDVIRVKLLPDPAYVDINVTSSGYATALGNGWYQVVVPIADIPGAASADGLLFETIEPAPAASFTYLLTDVGFSGTGGGDGGGGGELLTNGDFEASASDKAPWINAGGIATNNFYTADAVDGQQVFETNLSQVLDITENSEYVLSFRARSSVARNILAGFGDSGPPFAAVVETVALTTEWQTFSYTLTATGFGGADSRVLFDMGGTSSTVDIDNVSLTLSAGGSELLTNGDFQASASDKAPWINAGGIATNNFYTADAVDGQQVFETNLSQVLDITENSDYVLSFRAKASVARNILAGFGDSGPPFAAVTESVALTTEWQAFTYNLTATGFGGADSRVLFDMGGTTSTVNIDDVSLTLAGGGGGGGGASGDIAINGGFETGAFNDGSPDASWQQFPGDGVQMITTDNPSSGTYAAHLNIPVRGAGDPGVDNLIKNANLEAGNLTPGGSITVDFDMRGAFVGASGVVFAELFSELSGGGTSKAEILGGGPLTPNATWTPYSFTTTLGADVSGGVTLQLKVGCGAVEGCGADVFFDNVTITPD